MAGQTCHLVDVNSLSELNTLIHDRYFELRQLSAEEGGHSVKIHFRERMADRMRGGQSGTDQLPIDPRGEVERFLLIDGVISYEIAERDCAEGWDIFNVAAFDAEGGVLTIDGCLWYRIVVKVRGWRIRIGDAISTLGEGACN